MNQAKGKVYLRVSEATNYDIAYRTSSSKTEAVRNLWLDDTRICLDTKLGLTRLLHEHGWINQNLNMYEDMND